jgi:hypothetical protein
MQSILYTGAPSIAVRQRSCRSVNPELRMSRASRPRVLAIYTPFWRRDIVSTFIVVSAITLVFCLTVIIGSLKTSILPQITGEDLVDVSSSAYAPSSKDNFLLRLNSKEQRKLSAQVHYVSELIRSTRSKTQDISRMAYAIVLEARRLDLDPLFVAAVIKSESAFDRKALSYAGALGLMQLMPATAKYISEKTELEWHGISRLKDPYYNIKLGTAYLKYLEELFDGNREQMLIAYNWGPTNLNTALKQRTRIPGSPRQYAHTIISNHARWNTEFAARLPEFQYLSLSNVG